MQKIICKKVYDTATATLVKKVTFGVYGDPKGYEESLYQTESGHFFLYTNGGAESKYTKEDITRMGADKKDAWLKANS
ncbi:MAG: hypothetical protein E7352_06885 [Clostridiales bacterium]|nr:hypothetical protein [Clostridiales bacterium]